MRYSYARLGLIATAVFVLFSTVFYATLPDDRPFSCRTLKTCGFKPPPAYPHEVPAGFFNNTSEDEGQWADGTLYYRREVPGAGPKILFLAINKDATTWGKDTLSTGRTIDDFINLLITTDLDFTGVSLGVMTASRDEFDAIRRAAQPYPFARISVFYRKEDDGGPDVPYADRHKPEVQRQRRQRLAVLRNYLMLRSLEDEPHLVWVDADIAEFSPGIVQAMVAHAEARPGDVGLITARCSKYEDEPPGDDYDRNAWRLDRAAPGLLGPVAEKDHETAALRLGSTRHQVDELATGTKDGDLIPLDSVGGTILYVRAALVHRGLSFPPFYVVGTTFARDGWVGIETEGICYVAQQLGGHGAGCFLLGGSHKVRHVDSD